MSIRLLTLCITNRNYGVSLAFRKYVVLSPNRDEYPVALRQHIDFFHFTLEWVVMSFFFFFF